MECSRGALAMHFRLAVLLLVAVSAVSTTTLSTSPATGGRGLVSTTHAPANHSTLDDWLHSVGHHVVPDPTESVFDEDHLPRRPAAFDDRSFAKAVRNVTEGLRNLPKRKRVLAAAAAAAPRMIVVAKDGSGHFRTVQAAIDSISSKNARRVVVYVKKGVYTEKVRITSGKRFVTLKGESASLTTIQWGDMASTVGKNGKPLGTYGSASVAVEADNFIALDISFKNTAPAPPSGAVGRQAVALRIQGDKAAFYRCSFYGAQDTLYDKEGRHYYYNCYIEGSIDFIFGDGRTLFVKCHLHSIAKPYGSISAQKRGSASSNTGYSFVSCVVSGSGYIYLGRAWGAYSRVVFSYTYLASIIRPEGWNDFGVTSSQRTVFYGEYKCSGPGANRKGRVSWSRSLSDRQAKPFLSIAFIDGAQWLPK